MGTYFMFINYNDFEVVQYKDYIIDHDQNIKLLETLCEFIGATKDSNLNYYLTGSISLAIISKKVYRTWGDIDVIVDKDSIYKWIALLPKKKWHYYDFNKDITRVFYSKYNNYVELNIRENSLYLYDKKYLNIQEYYGIRVGNPRPMFFWKKNVRKNKKAHDADDENFYKQYLDV
jgi:hypothetical protein